MYMKSSMTVIEEQNSRVNVNQMKIASTMTDHLEVITSGL